MNARDNVEITTYEDEKGFVFISYCREEEEKVFEKVVLPLQQKYGLRVFFDRQFDKSNDNWVSLMNTHLEDENGAKAMLAFVSNTYISKYACLLEIFTAAANGIKIIPIYLDGSSRTLEPYNGDKKEIKMSASTKEAFISVGGILRTISDKGSDVQKTARIGYDKIAQELSNDTLKYRTLSINFKKVMQGSGFSDKKIKEDVNLQDLKDTIDSVSKDVYELNAPQTDSEPQSKTNIDSKPKFAPASAQIAPNNNENSEEKETAENTQGKAFKDNESIDEANALISATEKSERTRRATSTGDINYTLYGKEYTDNQANMMLRVFAQVLKRHPEAIDKIFENPDAPAIRCVSRKNYELPENRTDDMLSCYNQGVYFDLNGGIYVGTSLNFEEKKKNISRLLTICEEDFSVLQSDSIELPKSVGTRNSSGDKEHYFIYGKEYSGNQAQMMTDVLKFIIEKHFDKKEALAELLSIKLAPLAELEHIVYFRQGKEFTYQGVTYSIGTSFSREAKLVQIKKAIKICEEDMKQFEIDSIENVKTSVSKTSRKINFFD